MDPKSETEESVLEYSKSEWGSKICGCVFNNKQLRWRPIDKVTKIRHRNSKKHKNYEKRQQPKKKKTNPNRHEPKSSAKQLTEVRCGQWG